VYGGCRGNDRSAVNVASPKDAFGSEESPVNEVIEELVSQYAEETAFMWSRRNIAAHGADHKLSDLIQLDDRLAAYIEGLHVSGISGWHYCEKGLEHHESGEAFAAAVLALETCDSDRLDKVLDAVDQAPQMVSGIASAFGWVDPVALRATVSGLLRSQSAVRRRIAIAACALHRVNPGAPLATAVAGDDLPLQRRALRAVGEIRREDLKSALVSQFSAADPGSRFWAAWSSVLLGDRQSALELLKTFGRGDSPFRTRAMQVALRVMTPKDAREWLKELRGEARYLVLGAGITGDPTYVPWLIKQMETPDIARIAGEAFSMITGADLALENLVGKSPEGFESGPTENPEDENVAMDPDGDLPWPDPQRTHKWWEANTGRFTPGQRYLVGKPVSAEHCQHVLREGYQRQRSAAALELALMDPAAPLFETRAPGFRQQRQLAKAR
jgi:uncharacterized protein (TIGR02270 family)